jgi:alpha-1,6-mannosyltransferase
MADLSAAIADEQVPAGENKHRRPRPDPPAPDGPARGRPGAVWWWGALGLVASVLVALAGVRLATGGAISWWFSAPSASHAASTVALYAGMLLLAVAWLGLGRTMRAQALSLPRLYLIAAAWALPLALGPALYSKDVYSYLALGTLVHLGYNPYHDVPSLLAGLGHGHVLATVSPFWRHTTAPYGPLFLGLSGLIVSVTGSHLIAGVLLIRLAEIAGLALAAAFLPRLARALGSDPARAVWLALLSPLTLLELVAAGHNDALMIGLLIAGVTLSLEGRPLVGIVLCLAAATIKIPAAAGAVFIALAWVRTIDVGPGRWRFLAQATVLALATIAALSALSGLGASWLSTSVFSTPAKVHLAITPATALGWTAASLLHDVGIGVGTRALEDTLAAASTVLVAAGALWLLWRVRVRTLVPYLGAVLLLAAAGGPAAWPWYLTWGLVLLAGVPGVQRSLALPLAIAASVFLVKADGILALPLHTAPFVLGAYVVIAVLVWRGRGRPGAGRREPLAANPAAQW